jgi:hypothetical protein
MPARRAVLWRLVGDGLLAGVMSGLLLSPVLYAMFDVQRDIALPPHWPVMFSTDALNLLVPTMTSAIGGGLFLPVSGHFSGFLEEQDGYIGIVLLLIVVRTIRAQTDPALARFLGWLLAIILLASFGPQLWLGGMRTNIALPWALVVHLPLLKSALPGRLMVYAALLAAVIVALFVAAGQQVWRLWLGILACLSLLPVPNPSMAVPYSAFFAPGRVQQVLGTHAKLLIVPFGIEGPSSFWQAENRFGFAQTGGYLGFPPGAAQRNAAMMRLYFGVDMSAFPADFTAYCHATGTQYVIAGPGTVPAEWAALRALDWRAERIDDVTMYVVPPT